MKRVMGYVLLGLLAYVGFVVATFPAERALVLLKQQAPAQTKSLRATGISGSVWSGQAGVLEFQGQRVDKLHWQLKPWTLVTGALALDLQLTGKEMNGNAGLSLSPDGSVLFSAVDLRLPADRVSSLLNLPVDLGGRFSLQLDEAQLQGDKLQSISGELDWQRAAVIKPLAQSLGEYHATLSTDDKGIQAVVKDKGGPLQLAGQATLNPDGRYRFDGTVLVRDTQQTMLVQGVRALGRPASDGRVPLKYNGKL